ncbi:MAG: hypothetical protein IPH28_21655 [Cytophagaceae bacterium]|nr:hypothetical protein [Cytophagaceae bacterium]
MAERILRKNIYFFTGADTEALAETQRGLKNNVYKTMAFLNANGIKYTTEDYYDDEGNYSGTKFIID